LKPPRLIGGQEPKKRTPRKPVDPGKLICVAAIAGAFGVKGEVKVKSFTEKPEDCLSYGPLMNEMGQIILTPLSHRRVKGFLAVKSDEFATREDAEAHKSMKLYVNRAALPEPEEDEFYYEDLVGLEVKSTEGRRLGKVVAVHEFGAGDMLEIKPKEGASWFHPFTKAAVPKVDLKAGRIVVVLSDEN